MAGPIIVAGVDLDSNSADATLVVRVTLVRSSTATSDVYNVFIFSGETGLTEPSTVAAWGAQPHTLPVGFDVGVSMHTVSLGISYGSKPAAGESFYPSIQILDAGLATLLLATAYRFDVPAAMVSEARIIDQYLW